MVADLSHEPTPQQVRTIHHPDSPPPAEAATVAAPTPEAATVAAVTIPTPETINKR